MKYKCNECGDIIDEQKYLKRKTKGKLICPECDKGTYEPYLEENEKPEQQAINNYTEFEKTIINTYPMPLSIPYKAIVDRTGNTSDQIDPIILTITNILKYTALILKSEFLQSPYKSLKIYKAIEKLFRPALGDWDAFIKLILKLFTQQHHRFFIPEIVDFYNDVELKVPEEEKFFYEGPFYDNEGNKSTVNNYFSLIQALIVYRNKHSHQPTIDAREKVEFVKNCKNIIDKVLAKMEFVSKYTFYKSISKKSFQSFMGQSPSIIDNPNFFNRLSRRPTVNNLFLHNQNTNEIIELFPFYLTKEIFNDPNIEYDFFIYDKQESKDSLQYTAVTGKPFSIGQIVGRWKELLRKKDCLFDFTNINNITKSSLINQLKELYRQRIDLYTSEEYYQPDLYVSRRDIELIMKNFIDTISPICLITGEAGMGKTSILMHIANRLSNEDGVVVWFNTSSQMGSDTLDSNIVGDLSLNGSFIDLIKRLHSKNELPKKIVLIIDAVNEHQKSDVLLKSFEDMINELGGITNIKIIASIRFEYLKRIEEKGFALNEKLYYFDSEWKNPYIRLRNLERNEKKELYNNLASKFNVKTRYEDIQGNRRLQRYFNNPFFMRLLCEAFSDSDIPPKLVPEDVFKEYYKKVIITIEQNNKKQISKKRKDFVYELSKMMLENKTALLDFDLAYQNEILTSAIRNTQTDSAYVQLKNINIINEFVEDFKPYIAYRMNELSEWLIADAFLQRKNDDEILSGLLLLEPHIDTWKLLEGIIKVVLLELYRDKKYNVIVMFLKKSENAKSINILSDLLNDLNEANDKNIEKLINPILEIPEKNSIELILDFTNLLIRRFKYDDTKKYLTLIETLMDNSGLEEQKALVFFRKAQLCEGKALYKEALESYNKALEKQLAIFGETNTVIAMTYNNIGSVYQSIGNYNKALEYYNKSLNIRLNLFGEDNPYTATTYNNIGFVYSRIGDYNKALECYEKSLNIRLSLFGENHPYTATSYNNMGFIYSKSNENDKALEYYEKSLNIRLSLFGENHPYTATSYNNMGFIYSKIGDYEKAIEYYKKALTIKLDQLGENHHDTATIYSNIGLAYESKKETHLAIEYYEKAFKILEKILKNKSDLAEFRKHIDEINSTLVNKGN